MPPLARVKTGRLRLGRAVKRAIFVRFRQAALAAWTAQTPRSGVCHQPGGGERCRSERVVIITF